MSEPASIQFPAASPLDWAIDKEKLSACGFLVGEPETPLFYVKSYGPDLRLHLLGAFIPTVKERQKTYQTFTEAGREAEKYLRAWLLNHGELFLWAEEIDPEAPIPYEITPAGLAYLEQRRSEKEGN